MSQNIPNGGLVTVFNSKFVFSDFRSRWFMNAADENIYYSDLENNNFLCCASRDNPAGSVILRRSCKNVILNSDWIYYINEDTGRICKCLHSGKSETLVVRETATEFVLFKKDEIIYAVSGGSIKNGNGKIINGESIPVRMCLSGNMLYYADANNDYKLTRLDISSLRERVYNVVPSFINCEGDFVYFINRLDRNYIYRLDTSNDNIEKICGESALYPHIINVEKDVYPPQTESWLYFWQGKRWKRLSLDGGASEEV